uniref:Peptidase A1 domain-containing protein n=1 Tax=Nelumbo nucifera TaxID=4432 RepID=A0A822YYQ0_NELNU|nr:TPA_asm: hypothetical protein HUJ06_007040 [Nelumbo nucifera]
MDIHLTSLLRFILSSSTILLLFLSCCWYKIEAHGEEMIEVEVNSFLPETTCMSSQKGSDYYRNKLQLVDKHGPCSPLGKKNLSIEEILLEDQLRVRSIHSMIGKQFSPRDYKAKIPTKAGYSLKTGNFIVNIGLGTPKKYFWVSIDTGSSLTWIRCQPCSNCSAPTFNPSKSSSYSSISCTSPDCSQLGSNKYNSPQCTNCMYQIHYADTDFSIGNFGREKLTLTSSDVVPSFQFGCGLRNSLGDSTSGLLGLGPKQVSLVSQTAAKFGKVFSYCFPRSASSTGYLAFGNQTGATSSGVKYTQMRALSRLPDNYFVLLMGISVNGQRLNISSSAFTDPGTIIDSGSLVTHLPRSAYNILRAAFQRAMSNYPSAPPTRTLDTCYNLSRNRTVNVPAITLHFEGGTDIQLDPFSGVLFKISAVQYCLAFAPNRDLVDQTIIGNLQQRTYEVIYDVPRGRLGFRAVGVNC